MDKILEFLGIPSPSLLLGILAAMGAVAGWSYHLGDQAGANRVEAHYSGEKDKAADALSAELEAAKQRALAADVKAKAVADRAWSDQKKLTEIIEGLRNGKIIPAACFDADLRVRLGAAIRTINGYLDPPSSYTLSLPAKLPTVAGAGQ